MDFVSILISPSLFTTGHDGAKLRFSDCKGVLTIVLLLPYLESFTSYHIIRSWTDDTPQIIDWFLLLPYSKMVSMNFLSMTYCKITFLSFNSFCPFEIMTYKIKTHVTFFLSIHFKPPIQPLKRHHALLYVFNGRNFTLTHLLSKSEDFMEQTVKRDSASQWWLFQHMCYWDCYLVILQWESYNPLGLVSLHRPSGCPT